MSSRSGLCPRCARRARLSRERFAGEREAALRRDNYQCRICGNLDQIVLHHRRPGVNVREAYITLCRGCHNRIHHTHRPGFGFLDMMRRLWREVNADVAEQRLLELLADSGVPDPPREQCKLFEFPSRD